MTNKFCHLESKIVIPADHSAEKPPPPARPPDNWQEEASTLIEQGNFLDAEIVIREALTENPGNPSLLVDLGNLYSHPAVRRNEEAAAAYHHSLMAGGDIGMAYMNLGRIAINQNALDIGEKYTAYALAANPDLPLALNNLGTISLKRGDIVGAANHYTAAIARFPDNPLIRFNTGLRQLLEGREIATGWENAEARLDALPGIWRGPFSEPWWDGSPLPDDAVLLLHYEQGLGDTLQCFRYIEEARRRCRQVVVWVQSPLAQLLAGQQDVQIVTERPERFDVHCPLFSLPHILGTAPSAGNRSAYLHARPDRRHYWESWLNQATATRGKPRVGIVWAGNPAHANDYYRSIPREQLDQLLTIAEIDWISLQKESITEEAQVWLDSHGVIDPMRQIENFVDTAALLDCIDLLITIDSSVAHLAGAMGRPTWLLLPANPDWRWNISHPHHTEWYPSMRLFRQDILGDWNKPLQEVRDALVSHFDCAGPAQWITQTPLPPPPAPEYLADRIGDAPAELVEAVAKIPFWQHRIHLPGKLVTPGHAPLAPGAFDFPENLEGLRVLDVGARDGFWTFEALKRGARQVVAIDDFSDRFGVPEGYQLPTWENFDLCRQALGYDEAQCVRQNLSVYDVSEALLGRFDVILCYGVLHQFRHPLLALDRLAAVCDGELRIESPILDHFSPYRGGIGKGYAAGDMVMEFYPTKEYAGNPVIKWIPTLQTLGFMLHAAGFEDVEGWQQEEKPTTLNQCRGFVRATRRPAGSGAHLLSNPSADLPETPPHTS